ncbi:MAG: hypothetical protein JSU65_13125 [Candidatus Zixiibacteriota bacterium]|nr:MAG: hypothetical protein JSU65_13125 [candidate division Zixibacteria bacterium]
MKKCTLGCGGGIAIFVLLMMGSVVATEISTDMTPASGDLTFTVGNSKSSSVSAAYTGTLRVYVAERFSRYRDSDNHPYEYGFLDFALVESLNIPEDSTWEQTVVWDAEAAGMAPINEYHIMAMAVVFNSDGTVKDADPGEGNWFTAHYGDAAASADTRQPGRNKVIDNYSHTVFVEEGTATW